MFKMILQNKTILNLGAIFLMKVSLVRNITSKFKEI